MTLLDMIGEGAVKVPYGEARRSARIAQERDLSRTLAFGPFFEGWLWQVLSLIHQILYSDLRGLFIAGHREDKHSLLWQSHCLCCLEGNLQQGHACEKGHRTG